jgi:hypothetical protein
MSHIQTNRVQCPDKADLPLWQVCLIPSLSADRLPDVTSSSRGTIATIGHNVL